MVASKSKQMTRRSFSLAALGATLSPTIARAADAPTTAAEVWRYLAGLPAQERSAVIAREAAREGTVGVCGAEGIDRVQVMIDAFNQKYPNIKVDFVRLTQADTLTRLLAEQRSNHVTSDLVITSTTYLDLMKSSLAAYQQSSWGDWDSRFLFGGNDAGWTAVVYELLPTTIAWRTDRGISAADKPKTLADVGDAKWKGRAGCTSQLEEFINAMTAKYGEADGMSRVGKLAALDNHLVASNAALADALGSGDIDLAWNFVAQRAYFLQNKGAPIEWVFMDPDFGQGVSMSPIKSCPHPYAAALFLDFLLDSSTLERLDKQLPGCVYGNRKGSYTLKLDQFSNMVVYGPIAAAQFKKLNSYVEENFVRRAGK